MNYSKKINYAILVTGLQRGGAEKVSSTLFNNLHRKKVYLITFLKLRDLDYKLNDYSKVIVIDNFNIKSKLLRFILDIRALVKVTKSYKFKSIISLLPNSNLRLLISSFFIKIKTIISVRNDPKEFKSHNPFYYLLTYILYRFASVIVYQNKYQMNFYRFANVFKVIIPNPVSIPKKYTFKVKSKISNILFIGRLEHQKNPKFLIDVLEILLRFIKVKLHIFGEGSLKPNLILHVKRLKLENNVIFHSETKNVIYELQKYDLFSFPSKFEGFPNVLIEAMSVGCPIITTPFSGGFLEDYGIHKENIFISSFDTQDYAYSILKYLNVSSIRKKISLKSRKFSLRFSESKISNRWLSLLKK
jgi:glycosyltransferase involved in cell wall biosynthesis